MISLPTDMPGPMPAVQVVCGEARAILATLPEKSVHCCVTSPPYLGLRDYGTEPAIWGGDSSCAHTWSSERYYREGGNSSSSALAFSAPGTENARRLKETRWRETTVCTQCGAWCGQLGTEPTPQLFVAHLVEVFRAVRRVLRDDGTLWVVMGDSFASTGGHTTQSATSQRQGRKNVAAQLAMKGTVPPGVRNKSLLGVPWRLAFALVDDGWILRQEIIWAKGSCMPESVTDRTTRAHETIFMFAKQGKYFYDAQAIAEPSVSDHGSGNGYQRPARLSYAGRGQASAWEPTLTRNKRSVWTVNTAPLQAQKYGVDTDHYASFPPELIRPMVRAGTSEHGVCPACGAPWKRMLKKQRTGRVRERSGGGLGTAQRREPLGLAPVEGSFQEGAQYETVGWEPTCPCDAGEPTPATVLDPFCGSGTTGLVARQEWRHTVLIDINPDYVALAEARLRGELGLFTEVGLMGADHGAG